jgi:glucose-6-phosphate 1-epimerase
VIRQTRLGGLAALELTARDGAQAVLTLHGAQVVSWKPAGHGEQLFVAARAVFSEGVALRGGIPIVFPQFGAEGPLPRHGFARVVCWQVKHLSQDAERTSAVLHLRDSAQTWRLWQHPFEAELRVEVGGSALEIQLSVRNSGPQALSFTAALHTYLRIHRLDEARVRGLRGVRYRNHAAGGNEALDDDPFVALVGEVDRAYRDAPSTLTIVDGRRSLELSGAGFPDVVVWNPGPILCAAIPELDATEYRSLLAVEPAMLRAKALGPGESWRATHRLVCLTQ